uniref:Major facilitator superfamily (MFS) profile domain-containing protein n=1 Tax=Zooxanthella nutricula TaxID=1333877 RepID=A0A7S2IR98_9DINO
MNDLALALGSLACIFLVVSHLNNSWIKQLPKTKASSFTVQEVRAGFATVPLLIVVNLSFNMGYNAMNNAFPAQACQMNTLIGGTQLNGAFFNFGDALAIIVFTPLFESVCYPAIGKAKGSPVRLGQKLVTGLLVAGVANIVAAIMEVKRRQAPLMTWTLCSECAPNGIHMRDMSAFWMFIPFALVGAAEILVNPSMYYFAYTAAPPKVRSLVQAFNLFFNGAVSNAFSAVAMEATFPNDLDTGHMEYYYFLNVTCALVGVVLYLYLTRCGSGAGDLEEDVEDELDITERRPTSRTAELERRRTGSSADFERRRTCSTAELERRPSHGPATPHQ